jgi:hypothetical protein
MDHMSLLVLERTIPTVYLRTLTVWVRQFLFYGACLAKIEEYDSDCHLGCMVVRWKSK